MMGFSPPRPPLLLLSVIFSSVFLSCATLHPTFKGLSLENPALDISPPPLNGHFSSRGAKDVLFCERVKVSGHSRLKLSSYANSFRVTLAPSAAIPERLHSRIQVCFHRNVSLGLCQCEKDEWRTVQKGIWSSVMSPYAEKYIDVKIIGDTSGSVSIAVDEDTQQWRLFCLAAGFVLLLLAPIFSSWVPFYYSTSMAIGVFLVIIILLFQGMKLLPTGRKNIFYLSIYGSVLGAGTFILQQVSMLVNSILVNFGLSEEMHNPVYIFVLSGIVIAGAGLGYWVVRKYIISKDGSVDDGVAQFVKWAMRLVSSTFIFQSTHDTPLAVVALVSSCAICSLILRWFYPKDQSDSGGRSLWFQQAGQATAKYKRAEFLSRSGKMSPQGKMWSSPKSSSAWTNSPVKGLVLPSPHLTTIDKEDHYSTFHKTPKRRKYSKKQWEDFTRESTQQAVAEWAASPEVTKWIIENADRIQMLPSDYNSEEVGSESDSTDETFAESGKGFSLFNW